MKSCEIEDVGKEEKNNHSGSLESESNTKSSDQDGLTFSTAK